MLGRGDQRLSLVHIEVAKGAAPVPLGRDRHHPRDRVGVVGMLERGEAVGRADCPRPALRVRGMLPRSCSRWLRNAPFSGVSRSSRSSLEWLFAGLHVREGAGDRSRQGASADIHFVASPEPRFTSCCMRPGCWSARPRRGSGWPAGGASLRLRN
jgi:hypothetical protein